MSPAPLLRAVDLSVEFRSRTRLGLAPAPPVQALRGVSLDIFPGELLSLVGESGSGKSTLARAFSGLVAASAGRVEVAVPRLGRVVDPARASTAELRALRRSLGMVFQDPQSSLQPRLKAGAAVAEVLEAHGLASGAAAQARARALFERVGLEPAQAEAWPHALSGGQRQRVALARALAAEPSALVCDEVLSALDLPIAVELLGLLERLVSETHAALLFVTHDLGAARALGGRLAVMYAGQIVESGPVDEVLAAPAHPYTAALLAARAALIGRDAELAPLQGEPNPGGRLPSGCAFHPRCPVAGPECAREAPPLAPAGHARIAACWRVTPR